MAMNKLTAKQVQNAGKGKYSDSGGLYLCVSANGAKKWTLKFTSINGKRREMGLGSYPDIKLHDARTEAAEARKMIQKGLDPLDERKAKARKEKEEIEKAIEDSTTFSEAAHEYFENIKPTLKPTERGYFKWLAPLNVHVLAKIGQKRCIDITSSDIVDVLSPIWVKKKSTSKKVLTRIRKVLLYKEVNQSVIDGALRKLPPRLPALPVHMKSLNWRDVPRFFEELNDYPDTPARLCLQLVILTAVRSAEARLAQHDHFDFSRGVWTVPAELVKGPIGATKAHLVPMNQAIEAIVASAMKWHPTILFPSPSRNRPISDMSMTIIMRKMGRSELVHGFRSSFRDWAAENAEDNLCAEAQLHHAIGSPVMRAYLRTELLERRRGMMARWASFVVGHPIDLNIVQFPSRKDA